MPDSKFLIGASIQYQHDFDRQYLSTTAFSFRALWAAERWFLWIIAHFQSSKTSRWHSIKCDVPILLMQWIVVVLSGMILMCLRLIFTNNFSASQFAFSSRTLTCISFSYGRHAHLWMDLPQGDIPNLQVKYLCKFWC